MSDSLLRDRALLPLVLDRAPSRTVLSLAVAERQLAEADTIETIPPIIDFAEAMRVVAQRAHLGLDQQNRAAALSLAAQAKAGEQLAAMAERGERATAGSNQWSSHAATTTLAELGIERTDANRWSQVAGVPPDVRTAYVATTMSQREEVSRAGLLRYAAPHRVADSHSDEVPDLPTQPTVRLGDLVALGRHRLLCGDSTGPGDVVRLMGDALADCLWSDPPYGIEYQGKTRDHRRVQNDQPDVADRVMIEAFRLAPMALSAPFYVMAPAGPRHFASHVAMAAVGWRLHQELVWLKPALVVGHSDYHYAHELILYGHLPGPGRPGRGRSQGSRWYGDHAQSSVLQYPSPAGDRAHPTAKPVGLVSQCLRNSTAPGDLVYDPFAGSGATLIAAEQLGRTCYAIEIDPRYCQVIVERWERLTGRKAVLL